MLVTNPSRDTREALQKVKLTNITRIRLEDVSRYIRYKKFDCFQAVDFIELTMNTKVNELKPRKLRLAFQIWSSMMNNGKPNDQAFSKLLNDSDEPINPYRELAKSIFCRQETHTLPALGLAITERLPTHDPEPFVEMGMKLRQELQEALGRTRLRTILTQKKCQDQFLLYFRMNRR